MRLRSKYLTKILLHDSNFHKGKIVKYAKDYAEKYGLKDGKKQVQDVVAFRLRAI